MERDMQKESFFEKNKIVSFSIITSCMLFVGIFFIGNSQSVINMIPVLRGEVDLGNSIVITTTKNGYPILVKKDESTTSHQLRFAGDIRSNFSDLVFSLCDREGVVIDVGAHFGYRTIHFAKNLNGKGKVYAFEPNFGAFSNLRKTVVLNDLDNFAILKNIAISDYKGTTNIQDCLNTKKTPDDTLKPRNIVVDCNTLDDEMKSEQSVKLLSIDIPGSEFSILNGASDIISRSPDIVIVVAFDNNPVSKDAEQEFRKLEQNNFRFYIQNKDNVLEEIKSQDLLKQKEVVLVITRRTFK